MKTNKILLGGLAGGVTFFLLGWLVYGVLLNGYMMANTNQCAAKPMQDMVMWAMFLSNLALGCLLALIFSWTKSTDLGTNAKVAAIIGSLIALSADLGNYSMTNMYNNFSIIIVDVLVFSAMLAVTSIAVSLVLRKKEA